MCIRKLFQSRLFLFLIAFIPLILSISHYYSKYKLIKYKKENQFLMKIIEINDREPTYKLATYEGYQFPLERNRAQTELFNYLKLKQICKTNPNTTLIDIGASLGEFGLYGAACGCKVYMFEIEPKKLYFIEKSIEINSFQSKIILIKKAVSDLISNNTIYFNKNTSSQISQSIEIKNLNNNKEFYSGETISLNEFPFPSSISVFILRVDVQGHELHVFRSTEKLFTQYRIKHVIFEFTPWGTLKSTQKDIFPYMKTILGVKQFYALHPKQAIIYGPLNDNDIQLFYEQHQQQHLQRDVYALFQDDNQQTINANPYSFQTSF